MIKFFQIALMLVSFVSFVEPASADYLDTVGGPSVSTSPSATSAATPEAAKPVASLLKCAKNHGDVVIEEQPIQGQYQYQLTQNGFSPSLMAPMMRYAVVQSSCFSTLGRNTSTARWALKVALQNLNANLVLPKSSTATSVASFIPLVGIFATQKQTLEQIEAIKARKFTVDGIQVSLDVVDLETGDLVASIIGKAESKDVAMGTMLLSNASGALSGDVSQNPTAQLVASAYADAMNQVVPYMDKLNASTKPVATQAKK